MSSTTRKEGFQFFQNKVTLLNVEYDQLKTDVSLAYLMKALHIGISHPMFH